eukprot:TRINITY_DN62_c0_g1_i6.p1 TRINITY_DN62_c0_g1~~TRINITY_DN62_c0_g1_i6.p1  ORF type:complete len:148 (+),score=1.07 TRINITY_DN62_c0_g1_i6:654-1097(+)
MVIFFFVELKNLLFFFLFFLFLVFNCWSISGTFLVVFRRFRVPGLLAWALSEPLGKLGLGSLLPLVVLLLPQLLEMFSSYNFPSAFIEFSSVFVGPGVSSTFVLGIHANFGRIFTRKSPKSNESIRANGFKGRERELREGRLLTFFF